MATVALHIHSLNHCTETLAWQITLGGHHQVRLITAPDGDPTLGSEHATSAPRVARLPGVTRHALADTPHDSDLFILALRRDRRVQSEALDRWIRQTRRLGVILEGPYRGARDRLRELVRARPYGWRAQLVIRQHGGSVRAMFPLARAHGQYAPYVHPHIFGTPALAAQLAADPSPTGPRHRLVFIGNRSPAERAVALDAVSATLQRQFPQLRRTADPAAPAEIFWFDYDEGGARRGVAPQDYLAILQRADFCLCPAGWGGLWTHRTVEALACGAVPIVPDPEDYALGLRDGVNCLAVRGGRWAETVARALALAPAGLQALRANVAALRREKLGPAAAAARQRAMLGLAD